MRPRGSSYARIGLALLCLGWTAAARGQDSSLEERLLSKDPAVSGPAAKSVLAGADRAKPLLLLLAANQLFQSGSRDDAVFWNFAGMVRAEYAPPDERAYTTNTVERVIEGTTLRIPANYLTPFGLSAPAREAVTYVPLVMFFPSLEGYTPANWREVETSKDAVFVFIKRDSGARSVSTSVPCDANTASQGAGGRCEVVVVDPSSGLQIQSHFLPGEVARAHKLEARLGQLLKAWLVK